jgi:hypothetical protein
VFTKRFGGKFVKFDQPGIWYRVPLALANELALARQVPQRPGSPPVFDVMTETEARAVDRAEKLRRDQEKAVVEPSVDTAQDLAVGMGRGDLSLEETVAGRAKALEEATAYAMGGDEHPVKTISPRPVSADFASAPVGDAPATEPAEARPSHARRRGTSSRKAKKSPSKRKAKAAPAAGTKE